MGNPRVHREVLRASFAAVGETCPHVDRALEQAAEAIKTQTGSLREALNAAIERAILAEEEADILRDEVERLREAISNALKEMSHG